MSDIAGRLVDALAGRYTIERQLGEGGMATVYLANDVKHGRKVAIKVLKPELSAILGGEHEPGLRGQSFLFVGSPAMKSGGAPITLVEGFLEEIRRVTGDGG